jgi:hypothetical protein
MDQVCWESKRTMLKNDVNVLNSVFVFSLRAAFDCVFNLKHLKFTCLQSSCGV